MEVEKIKISITADASEAIKSYKKLADALGRLQALTTKDYSFSKLANQINHFAKATELAIKPLKELGDALDKIQKFSNGGVVKIAKATNAVKKAAKNGMSSDGSFPKAESVDYEIEPPNGEASSWVEDLGDEVEETNGKVKQATPTWKKYVDAIGKIAVYRLVRRLLTELGNAAKKGADNFYVFLNAQDDLQSKKLVRDLDKISTSMNALGNTLGVTLLTTLVTLSPLIEVVCQGLIQLGNVINALIAILQGSDTYYKANTEAIKKWSESIHNALQGFDELNVISSSASASPMEMFTKANVSDAISGLGAESAAVVGLASAFALLRSRTGGLTGAFKNKNTTLSEQSRLTETETSKVSALNTAFGKAKSYADNFSTALVGVGAALAFTSLLKNIDNLGEKAKGTISDIQTAFSSALSDSKEATSSTETSLGLAFDSIKDKVSGVVGIVDALAQAIKGLDGAKADIAINIGNGKETSTATPVTGNVKPGLATGIYEVSDAEVGGVPTVSTSTSTSNKVPSNAVSAGVAMGSISAINKNLAFAILNQKIKNAIGASPSDAVDSLIDDLTPDSSKDFFNQLSDSMSKLVGSLFRSAIWSGAGGLVPGFAGGGFVNSADVFYANENGVPEMVGRIGSRTAVANNEQITEAIASAVYEAITEAQQGGNVNVVLEGDAKKLFTVVQREARSYTRATGNYAF